MELKRISCTWCIILKSMTIAAERICGRACSSEVRLECRVMQHSTKVASEGLSSSSVLSAWLAYVRLHKVAAQIVYIWHRFATDETFASRVSSRSSVVPCADMHRARRSGTK